MKIIDISREFFSSALYPDDPEPKINTVSEISVVNPFRLMSYCAGTHTSTHTDAPYHCLEKGKTAEKLALDNYIGECTVVTTSGLITGAEIEEILLSSKPRILLRGKGHAFLTRSAAFVLCQSEVKLIGCDGVSIACEKDELDVHRDLLSNDIAIIENLELDGVYDGDYFLFAPPLKIGGADAAPLRAVLIKDF